MLLPPRSALKVPSPMPTSGPPFFFFVFQWGVSFFLLFVVCIRSDPEWKGNVFPQKPMPCRPIFLSSGGIRFCCLSSLSSLFGLTLFPLRSVFSGSPGISLVFIGGGGGVGGGCPGLLGFFFVWRGCRNRTKKKGKGHLDLTTQTKN